MLQGLMNFAMTVPAAALVFAAAYLLSRYLEREAARRTKGSDFISL